MRLGSAPPLLTGPLGKLLNHPVPQSPHLYHKGLF